MAQVRQTNTLGFRATLDNVVYYTVNGKTYARKRPIMPRAMFNTPAAKKRQSLFKLVGMHLRFHHGEFDHLFDKRSSWTAANAYHKRNAQALRAALDTLADRMVAGDMISTTEVENAIATYATANPTAIVLADKSPYELKFLTGSWPATITLSNASGSRTTIVHTNKGVSTTVFPDGASSSGTTPGQPPQGNDDDAIGE
ncbi:MAG: hypothetical protein MJZ81_12040 [Bacteroidales bacterium]|nr:hypothetical protein [Bacteroidales bacterium]MCQ2300838.1 hypothetical protein [Bacteroidales bacterium]